jgi:hypothetical protein
MRNPITPIIDRIFGHRYYAVIIGRQGSGIYEIASAIHRTKKEAQEHRHRIDATRTYIYIETVTFRSHNDFLLQ